MRQRQFAQESKYKLFRTHHDNPDTYRDRIRPYGQDFGENQAILSQKAVAGRNFWTWKIIKFEKRSLQLSNAPTSSFRNQNPAYMKTFHKLQKLSSIASIRIVTFHSKKDLVTRNYAHRYVNSHVESCSRSKSSSQFERHSAALCQVPKNRKTTS